ncbi:MAG: dTMP kinase [Candidatus Pacearchaeota archaeon]
MEKINEKRIKREKGKGDGKGDGNGKGDGEGGRKEDGKGLLGLLIAFDGIDGCGKSSIAKLIRDYLKKQNYKVLLTHEPSETTTGKKIKELVRKKGSEKFSRQFWLTLFTQDRLEHTKSIILPKLEEGFIVLVDRYYYSTLAYQLNENEWKNYLEKYRFVKPNIAFILDVDPKIGIERTAKRGLKKAIFERENFLVKVRKKYLTFFKKARQFDENIFLIDANQPLKKVFSDVKKIIDDALERFKQRNRQRS